MQAGEFKSIYLDLARQYPGRMDTDDDTIGSWYARLLDIPTEYVNAAINQLADDESVDVRYPPNALQIRRLARRMSGATAFDALPEGGGQISGDVLRLQFDSENFEPLLWERAIDSLRNTNRVHAAEAMERRYHGELEPIAGELYLSWCKGE